jgi:predicted nucleic acid-binding protein
MGSLDPALVGVTSILLDTAPVVYAIERHPRYSDAVLSFLDEVRNRGIELVVTPITLAECVAGADTLTAELFYKFCTETLEINFVTLTEKASFQAGVIRRSSGLKLPDALQVGVAFTHGSGLIFTNDHELAKRQSAVSTLMVDDLMNLGKRAAS